MLTISRVTLIRWQSLLEPVGDWNAHSVCEDIETVLRTQQPEAVGKSDG